jgi:hypothetical protein
VEELALRLAEARERVPALTGWSGVFGGSGDNWGSGLGISENSPLTLLRGDGSVAGEVLKLDPPLSGALKQNFSLIKKHRYQEKTLLYKAAGIETGKREAQAGITRGGFLTPPNSLTLCTLCSLCSLCAGDPVACSEVAWRVAVNTQTSNNKNKAGWAGFQNVC